MLSLGEWWGMKWPAKVRVQNEGRERVKPKNQLGKTTYICWFLNPFTVIGSM